MSRRALVVEVDSLIADLVDELAGLVTRRAKRADRRGVILERTPIGGTRYTEEVEQPRRQVIARYADADLETVKEVLEALRWTVARYADERQSSSGARSAAMR